MDIVFYGIIFILGAILGSFYATAIQRISKEKRVFGVHSYCTNCGKKLSFFEKIPILSYIFLRGKCKHCKKEIKSIYVVLELITAILFLIAALGLELKITDINITDLISFIFVVLYFSYIIVTIGLDAKGRNISSSVLAFGIIISLIYIVYMCVAEKITIYKNIVHLIIMALLLLANVLNTRKRAQSSYIIDTLTTLLIMEIFTQEITCIITIIGALIATSLYIIINKIRTKSNKKVFAPNVKIVYIMGVLNIFIFLALINIAK